MHHYHPGRPSDPFFNIGCYIVPVLPYRSLQASSAFPVLVLLILQLSCHAYGDTYNKYFEGVQFSQRLLNVVDYIWITVPKESFHRVRPGGLLSEYRNHGERNRKPGNQPISACPRSLTRNLQWSFGLWTAERGIGWNYQIKNVPPGSFADTDRW